MVTVLILLASSVSEFVGLARLQAVSKAGTTGQKVIAYLFAMLGLLLAISFALGAFAMFFAWRDPGYRPLG